MSNEKEIILNEEYRSESDRLLEQEHFDNSIEAFTSIKNITTSHEEYYTDEDLDGNLVYESWQEFDGSIEDQFPYTTKIILRDLHNYKKLKERIKEMYKFFKDEIETGKDIFGNKLYGVNKLMSISCLNQFSVLKSICEEEYNNETQE